MGILFRAIAALALFSASLTATIDWARAQSPAEFYKGKTVRLVTGGSPGSGYDLYARMLVPYLQAKIGASVVVESRPGAGMMIAMNHVAGSAPDGLTIMLAPAESAVLAKLTDDPAARFDLRTFPVLARVNTAPRILIANPKLPWKTFGDMLKWGKPIQIAGNGKTDAASDTFSVLCHAMKIPCKVTIGYPGSREMAFAIIAGEMDATILVEDSSARYSEGGQMRPLVVTSREKSTLMPDVPTIFAAAPERMDAEAAWWIDFREDVRKVGRLLIAPPGTAPDRVAFLRRAAKEILTDAEALADFEKKQQPAFYGEPADMSALLGRLLGDGLSPARRAEVKMVITEEFY